jgi:tetratricopeptide (TPR) repeat protein
VRSHQLTIVAVTRYADACPPQKHPDCPYARPTESGRTCGTECRKVITNLVRPTLRNSSPDYDAGQRLLTDQEASSSPTRDWATSSLLSTLNRVARTFAVAPDGTLALKRAVDGTSALGILGERDIDPRDLLVFGYGRTIRLTLDTTIGVFRRAKIQLSKAALVWANYRESASNGAQDEQLSAGFRRRLRHWMLMAEPYDILTWTPPSPEAWEALPDEESPVDEREVEFRWLAERLSHTYLNQWSDDALAFEYRFLAGHRPNSIPGELAYERFVASDSLNAELASRRVVGHPVDVEAVEALVERAKEAIMSGNRSLAASIFELALTMNPRDQVLANNRAFCLIFDDTARAIGLLEEAARIDAPTVLIVSNLALCQFLLGKYDDTLSLCHQARAIGLATGAEGWMWELESLPSPSLAWCHSGVYLCDLAMRAIAAGGLQAEHEDWQALRNALTSR